MNLRCLISVLLLLPLMGSVHAWAQDPKNKQDTTKGPLLESIRNSDVSKKLLSSVTKKKSENKPTRSEENFKSFEGKIIRKIIIRQIGFERTVTDTTKRLRTTVARMANKVHRNTREEIIRNNLFIREGRELNAYKMADNERWLRDLDFILDARFYVVRVPNTKDSVDVVVMTRDVFSLGGSISPRPSLVRFRLFDTNFRGYGQRIQFTGLVEQDRNPAFGYELFYRKNSVKGSFIDLSLGYTTLNTGSSYGTEEEKAFYLKLERPLLSPYTRMAGGIEVSRNWSSNFYQRPDSLFLNYRYVIHDAWVGYNIGVESNTNDRSRHFVAIRVFDQHFERTPIQFEEERNSLYATQQAVIGGVTFFKQDFYTTRYVFGFGRTEDIPYGHKMSVYAGWSRTLGLERPYLGFEGEKSIVTDDGDFYTIGFRTGSFFNNGIQDGVMLLSGALTSKIINYKKFLIRQSFNADFTHQFRTRTNLPLDINREFGLQGFVADSLLGTKRFHINTETLVFTPWQLLGFKFAPFVFGEMAVVAPKNQTLFTNKAYFGFGGGFRTRNENLVFGTLEFRMFYFPRITEDISRVSVRLTSNLRLKYTGQFVRAPSFVRYN